MQVITALAAFADKQYYISAWSDKKVKLISYDRKRTIQVCKLNAIINKLIVVSKYIIGYDLNNKCYIWKFEREDNLLKNKKLELKRVNNIAILNKRSGKNERKCVAKFLSNISSENKYINIYNNEILLMDKNKHICVCYTPNELIFWSGFCKGINLVIVVCKNSKIILLDMELNHILSFFKYKQRVTGVYLQNRQIHISTANGKISVFEIFKDERNKIYIKEISSADHSKNTK